MEQTPLGVVRFDDPAIPGPGVACDADGRVYEIEDPVHLASDTIWLTNIGFQEWYSEDSPWHGLHFGLRHEGWLRIPPRQLLTELCGTNDREAALAFLPVVRALMERVVRRAGLDLREGNPLQVLLPEVPDPSPLPGEVLNDLSNLRDRWVRVPTQRSKRRKPRAETRMYRPRRLDHYRDLLATPVPVGEWGRHEGAPSTPPPAGVGRVLRVRISNRMTETAPSAARLPGPDEVDRMRLYLLEREYQAVKGRADVEVLHYWEGPEESMPVPAGHEYSYVDGLVRELYARMRMNHPVYGPWLVVADRMQLYRHVRALADSGVPVLGYGAGKIMSRFRTGDGETAEQKRHRYDCTAIELGLEPPGGADAAPMQHWRGLTLEASIRRLDPSLLVEAEDYLDQGLEGPALGRALTIAIQARMKQGAAPAAAAARG